MYYWRWFYVLDGYIWMNKDTMELNWSCVGILTLEIDYYSYLKVQR